MNREKINALITKCGKDKKAILRDSGLSASDFNAVISEDGDPKVSAAESVAKAIGVPVTDFFDESPSLSQLKALEKTIAAQEKTISTQQMLIDLLTKTKSE